MTILLLGKNGQVGHELQATLAAIGQVVAIGHQDADLAEPDSLRTVVRRHRPDAIVNAAAYTAVDKAETDADRAFAVNATAPGVLAEEAEAIDAALVHFSTDYVFDGRKPTPYVETDATAPLSIYGRSKRDGELAVMRCRKHLIFRTSWVIGAHGHNFVRTILQLAKERPNLRVVADQFGAPTSAALLAKIAAQLLAQMISQRPTDSRWGLYHLVAGGETCWHDLACHAVAHARAMGLSLQALPETIEPITTGEYPTPAKRPANSRLATAKLRRTFPVTLPDWTVGVNSVLEQLIPEMHQ